MLLANLNTNEKEAFASLAYLVAKADGYLNYGEITLINLYMEEMGLDDSKCQSQQQPLINLCHVFSDQHTRKIVFSNLLSLAFADEYDNLGKKCILEVIQHELAINSAEAKRDEDGLKIITGLHFPNFAD